MKLWERVARCAMVLAVLAASTVGAPGAALAQDSVTPDQAAPDVLEPLIDVLNDEAARARLLEALSAAAQGADGADAADGAGDGAAAPAAPIVDQTPSLGSRIAEITQGAAETVADRLGDVAQSLTRSGSVLRGLSGEEIGVLLENFRALLLVIAITVAVFLTLRSALRPTFARIGDRAADGNAVRRIFLFTGSLGLDVAIVLVAWALGYAITLALIGNYAEIGFRDALYLNAFLIVELLKVGVRAILSPSTQGLRLINLPDRAARRVNRQASFVVSLLGYGHLLVVPIINRNLSFFDGLAVAALISLLAAVYLIYLVLRYKNAVADWLARRLLTTDFEEETDDTVPDRKRLNGFWGGVIRSWHWFALLYLVVLVLVVTTRPGSAVIVFLGATGQVIAALMVGSLILRAIGRSVRDGVHLPESIATHLPLLESRLNQVVPKALMVLRVVIALAIVGFSIDVIGLADIGGLMRSPFGLDLSGRFVSVAIILLIAALIWLGLNAYVDQRLSPDVGLAPTAREVTLLALARNAATIALFIFTLMFVLSEIGLDIGPLIASAGVLGLAIGFGAQKLVQDIITGVFIQFENAMNVGDVVTVGGTTGVVEKLTVRSVSLRDLAGTFHIIPFSSVDMVSNFMRDFAYYVCDMGIAYREDIDEARQAMLDSFDMLMQDEAVRANVIGDLEWFGLNSFGDSAVVLRARIKTRPGLQWATGRAYNAILKQVFDERGIEIPFPHQTVFFGEAKDGRTQALRLQNIDQPAESES